MSKPPALMPTKNRAHTALKPKSTLSPQSIAAPTTDDYSGPRSTEPEANRPAFQKLTEQQKDYRRKNNLCMYCGIDGHVVRECPTRPKSRPRLARKTEIVSVATPSGNELAQM